MTWTTDSINRCAIGDFGNAVLRWEHDRSPSDAPLTPRELAMLAAMDQLNDRIVALERRASTSDADSSTGGRPLARVIFGWLRTRNGGELNGAIESMTINSFELALEELESILSHGGWPPNWVTERRP